MTSWKGMATLALLGALSPVACATMDLDGGGSLLVPARPDYDATEIQRMRDAIQAALDAGKYTLEKGSIVEDGKTVDVGLLSIGLLTLYISAACLQPSGKLDCEALDGLLAVPGKDVEMRDGILEAYFCASAGGTVTSGYCLFSDGSVIATWTLVQTPEIILGPNPAYP